MAKKLSITIFVNRTAKNQTFLKLACKKMNKSKRPHKDWASCAILSQSSAESHCSECLESVLRVLSISAQSADSQCSEC